MIIGIGTDIVEVERVRELVERWGERFLKRLFTDNELSYCFRFRDPVPHLAARIAVKEAVFKCMGRRMVIRWRDLDIKSEEGVPSVALYGEIQRLADNIAVRRVHVSISHTDKLAMAIAVAEG